MQRPAARVDEREQRERRRAEERERPAATTRASGQRMSDERPAALDGGACARTT
jgi:hypothetical protein